MRKKYKLTGFARLLIFLVFFTPLAYIGASYYNGEDGIAKIKALLNTSENTSIEAQIEAKNREIEQLTQKIEGLKREVKRLEASK
ncbi:MAG: hypothetical protein AAGA77_08140 [Bacteroidota bacterium]